MTRASIASWLRSVLRRSALEHDLHEELEVHVELYTQHLIRGGMDPREARRRARAEFGAVEARKDECREALGLRFIDERRQDLRYALRQLRRAPGFTAVVVATLGIGIGANVAIFSVVHALLLKPLPFGPDADRLTRVMTTIPASESFTRVPVRFAVTFTADELHQVLANVHGLSEAGLTGQVVLRFSAGGEVGRVQAARVSSAVFRILHARTMHGRLFEPADDALGAQPVAILSSRFWQQQFHADPNVVGQTITLATTLLRPVERQFIIIGVMPADFVFPDNQTELWVPPTAAAPATQTPQPIRLSLLAVLAPGVSLQAAAAEVEPFVRRLRNIQATRQVTLVREQDEVVAPVQPALVMLMTTVGFVLLVACVNIANLLLARAAARQREMSIRSAIGASPGRLMRQALTESLLLTLLGGAAAVAFAFGGIRLLRALATTLPRFDLANRLAFPRLSEVSLNAVVLAFALGMSLVIGIIFGIVPAIRHGKSSSLTTFRGRDALVVVQIAVATVVLVAAGLLVRSFIALSNVAPGYDAESVVTFQVDVPSTSYPDARLRMFAETLTNRIRSMPGVEASASANQLPMVNMRDTAGGLWRTSNPDRGNTPLGDCRVVSRDYLRTLGIHVVKGRGFDERDGAGQPRVLLINQALARRQFAHEDPLGQLAYVGQDPAPWQIVGIVEDVRQFGLAEEADPQFFIDQRQWSSVALRLFPIGMYFAVRTADDPMRLMPHMVAVARELEPQAVVFNVATMQQIVATTIARPRLYAVLLGMFAAMAVMLAAIGVYGVMSYFVTRRTREFGIQMAIGAPPRAVLHRVLGQGLTVASLGIVFGIAASVLVSDYLKTLLFGLRPLDPLTFAGGALLFAVVAMLATYVPARRATKINPAIALRVD